jgi:hypothetical protein
LKGEKAKPTFSGEKVALFCDPALGGTFTSTTIEITKWVKKIAAALAKVSHILRPSNTAFKNRLSLLMVSKDSIQGYMRQKEGKYTHSILNLADDKMIARTI